jgi:hypothetical protein
VPLSLPSVPLSLPSVPLSLPSLAELGELCSVRGEAFLPTSTSTSRSSTTGATVLK